MILDISQVTAYAVQETARRAELAKKLKFKVNLNEIDGTGLHKLGLAVINLEKWYSGKTKVAPNVFLKAIKPLFDLAPYVPWDGPVFRAFPLPAKLTKKVVEGKDYRLKVAKANISSWTTSLSHAARFYTEQRSGSYVVVKLASKAAEVCNLDYIVAASNALDDAVFTKLRSKKLDPVYKELLDDVEDSLHELQSSLREYAAEDEVMMLVKAAVKVKVVLVVDAEGKKGSVPRLIRHAK